MFEVGTDFKGYEIVRRIGDARFLVDDSRSGRREVLTVARVRGDVADVGLFEQRVRVVAALDHPGVARVVASGLADLPDGGGERVGWVVSEYVAGVGLEDADASFSAEDLIVVAGSVAAALDYAHGRGVVHGDVSPSNVTITRGVGGRIDRVVLSGFGIPVAGGRGGADSRDAAYSAPEVVAGQPPTAVADQWALAAVMYRLLIGSPPGGGAAVSPVGSVAPEFAALDPVFERAFGADPRDRFGSCGEFAATFAARFRTATDAQSGPVVDDALTAPPGLSTAGAPTDDHRRFDPTPGLANPHPGQVPAGSLAWPRPPLHVPKSRLGGGLPSWAQATVSAVIVGGLILLWGLANICLLYTSPSPRDRG